METKKPIMTVTICDKKVLNAAYMPFLTNGGIFIPTARNIHFGEQYSLLLQLMNEENYLSLDATVVWITPKGVQGNRPPGIGLQFEGEQGKVAKHKIQTLLLEFENLEHISTHTI